MPSTQVISRPSEIMNNVTGFKYRISSCSRFFRDAVVFFNWAIDSTSSYDPADRDLESGEVEGIHPVMWYSLTCIRQMFSVDFLFGTVTGQTLRVCSVVPIAIKPPHIEDYIAKVPARPKASIFAHCDSFVDLGAIRFRHRLKSIKYGQKHVSKLLYSLTKPNTKRRKMTGDELSNYFNPPEPRGEDFRKWILVMETLFPTRATYLGAVKAHQIALKTGPGPKTGSLSPTSKRKYHSHLLH